MNIKLDFNTISSDFLLKFCISHHYPIAISKKPNLNYFDIIFSNKLTKIENEFSLFDKKGFVISPFKYTENTEIYLIESKNHFRFNIKDPNQAIEILQTEEFSFNSSNISNIYKTFDYKNKKKENIKDDENNNFEKSASKIINEIKNENVKKVVLSRKIKSNKKIKIDNIENFLKICKSYPCSFNSLIITNEFGNWMGSTPETLIEINENGIFKTVALAGTKSKKTSHSTNSEAQWTQKEIQEQALVSRYIVDCFKKIRVREYEENGPKTVEAGPLWHLKSEFLVDLNKINFENLPSVMLKLLNPTSAVCGMPHDKSVELILKYENFNRELFAGYIGLINIGKTNQSSNIYVNIRCMKIEENEIYLYAGAGITEDSNPKDEFDETNRKMNVIANTFNIYL